jgi:hypothetical protein
MTMLNKRLAKLERNTIAKSKLTLEDKIQGLPLIDRITRSLMDDADRLGQLYTEYVTAKAISTEPVEKLTQQIIRLAWIRYVGLIG